MLKYNLFSIIFTGALLAILATYRGTKIDLILFLKISENNLECSWRLALILQKSSWDKQIPSPQWAADLTGTLHCVTAISPIQKVLYVAFEQVSFIWDQEKKPGVGGTKVYLVFYGLLAPETGCARGYYLFCKQNIFGETAFITFPFIWDQEKRPGVGGLNIYLGFLVYWHLQLFTVTKRYHLGKKECRYQFGVIVFYNIFCHLRPRVE